MSLRIRRALSLLLLTVSSLALLGAAQPLNPTVKVLPKPAAPVPPECAQGLAPATTPRIATSEIPEPPKPARMEAPPTLNLTTQLRRTQAAAVTGDYETFKQELAGARAALAAYPAGGEKNAAADVMRVYDDVEHVWDYAQESPTGAFYQSGELLDRMKRYHDFAASIADATVRVGETTMYPTTESRRFLAREAAKRLTKLGIRNTMPVPTPTRMAESKRPPRVKHPAPAVAEHTTKAPRPAATTHHTATATHHKRPAAKKPATQIASAKPKPSVGAGVPARPVARETRATTPTSAPKPAPAPITPKPAPVPAPVTITPPPAPAPKPAPITPKPAPAPAPAPVPAPAVATTTTAPPPATSSTVAPVTTTTAATTTTIAPPAPIATPTTSSAPAPTDTAVLTPLSDTTATTTASADTSAPAVPPQPARTNLLFPIILIVIGVGVLIVLLRASS